MTYQADTPDRLARPRFLVLRRWFTRKSLTGFLNDSDNRAGRPLEYGAETPRSPPQCDSKQRSPPDTNTPGSPRSVNPQSLKLTMLKRGMTNSANAAIHLSDQALIDEVKAAAARERGASAPTIGLLAELDARRLYLGEGCSSLFMYCTQVLRLSEHAAYGRIEAARIARKFPVVLDLLAEGAVTLTTLTLLGPLLTPANHQQVLAEARHQSKREVEQLVARLRPLPPVAESVRKLPTPKAAPGMDLLADATSEVQRSSALVSAPSSVPPRQAVLTPLAPDRYKVQLTVARATHDKLHRAQICYVTPFQPGIWLR